MATTTDIEGILRDRLSGLIGRLAGGENAATVALAANLASNAAAAAAEGREDLIEHIGAQARSLAEAERVILAEEGWSIIDEVLAVGSGIVVDLAARGIVSISGGQR